MVIAHWSLSIFSFYIRRIYCYLCHNIHFPKLFVQLFIVIARSKKTDLSICFSTLVFRFFYPVFVINRNQSYSMEVLSCYTQELTSLLWLNIKILSKTDDSKKNTHILKRWLNFTKDGYIHHIEFNQLIISEYCKRKKDQEREKKKREREREGGKGEEVNIFK